MITQYELKELLSYNAETGLFTWIKINSRRIRVGTIAGAVDKDGYVTINVMKVKYRAHRLAWLYVHGKFPDKCIDHINGIKTDNRLLNLRDVNRSINNQNIKKPRRDNKTGYLGVTNRNGSNMFEASIRVNNKKKYLGKFDTAELAYEAYVDAKRKLHEGCTI